MQQYIGRALQVTWNLATAVPPFITSCEMETFSDEHHEKAPTAWDDRRDSKYILRYFRPVLFNFSSGVQTRGCVTNVNLDAGNNIVYSPLVCSVLLFVVRKSQRGRFGSFHIQELQCRNNTRGMRCSSKRLANAWAS